MDFRVVPLGSGRFTAKTLSQSFFRSGAGYAVSATCSVQPGILYQTAWLLSCCFEALIDRLRLLGCHGDLLILLTEFFLNEGQRVISRRKALDLILPIFIGDGVEGALHHVDVHLHPWMLVALHRQHDFFTREILLNRRGRRRLRFVPLPVVLGSRMDVV